MSKMIMALKNLFSAEPEFDYEKILREKVDAFLVKRTAQRRVEGKLVPVGTNAILRVAILRAAVRAFELANEVYDPQVNGTVYLAVPFDIDFQDDRWPWLVQFPALTDGMYLAHMKAIRDVCAQVQDNNQGLKEIAGSAFVIMEPKELAMATKVLIRRMVKESEDNKLPMRVFSVKIRE